MNRLFALIPLALTLALVTPTAHAADHPCAALDADRKAAAERVMASVYPHDCCDQPLATCLAKEKPSRLTKRLAAAVCRKIAAGRSEDEVRDALERRGESMIPIGKPGEMDLSDVSWAGCEEAPVSVVVYACARCPFCSKVIPALHEEVTKGPLAKKVRLAFREFPVKGHEGSTEGALAFAAAGRLGAFWPYLLRLYGSYDDFAVSKLTPLAEAVGLDAAAFEAAMKEGATRKSVVAAKKEGLRLGVKATPTLFIDGHRYKGDLDRETLRDVLLEAWERKQGTICQP